MTDVEVKLTTPEQPELKIQGQPRIFNLGRGGAFVAMDPPLAPEGAKLNFEIDLEGPEKIKLSGIGVVRWTRDLTVDGLPTGVGLEFIFLDEPGRSQLPAVLNRLGRTAFIPKT